MSRAAASVQLKSLGLAATPWVFVLLWSTGFIGAKLGLPHAEPFTFLALRFALVLALMVPIALWRHARWPTRAAEYGHLAVVGLLVHGVYLGGVFAAIDRGMPAGLAALLVALQPLITAVLIGPIVGDRVTGRQWLGFALGLGGVALVFAEKLAPESGSVTGVFTGFGLDALAFGLAAPVAIAVGTLYQKRFATHVDLQAGTTVQYLAAGALMLALALASESMTVEWHPDFVIAMAWLVLVMSLGAVSLLMLLIRLGAAARTASLFYLVPPSTALIAWLLFDERLGWLALAGMAVASLGVALVVRR
ncbi:MAG: DMT family transporter [Rhodovibrionaceae bacterium]|nr:DMT family transporter [Rhodovibrionaceae bacterium]